MMGFNWIDGVILAVLVYHLFVGWKSGLIYLGESFIAYLVSLWLAIKFHASVGGFLSEKFGIPVTWSTVLGYIIVALLSQTVLSEIGNLLVAKVPKKIVLSKANNSLGALVSVLNGLLFITFILLVIVALPLRGTIKRDVNASLIGSVLIRAAETYGGQVKSTLNEATREALRFFTVAPTSKERIPLDINPEQKDLVVDKQTEQAMLAMVNNERAKVGVAAVSFDEAVAGVARAHSKDMFVRKYFSHVSPEGNDVGDRMDSAELSYSAVGENLAYAPDLITAHDGLMNSEGHRKNILDPTYERVGIGVIDSGTYGMMFTQVFVK